MALAEKIKCSQGGLVATGRDDRDMTELSGDTGDWEHDRREISRSELIGIMRPRVEETLEGVRACLDAAGFDSLPSQKVVLKIARSSSIAMTRLTFSLILRTLIWIRSTARRS